MSRTTKDEKEFDAGLRREELIKTEVIVELRASNRQLWETQAVLLTALIEAQDALRVYRIAALGHAKALASRSGDPCVPGCSRHVWDTNDGWHRTDEK